jgi:hypothetical protein
LPEEQAEAEEEEEAEEENKSVLAVAQGAFII